MYRPGEYYDSDDDDRARPPQRALRGGLNSHPPSSRERLPPHRPPSYRDPYARGSSEPLVNYSQISLAPPRYPYDSDDDDDYLPPARPLGSTHAGTGYRFQNGVFMGVGREPDQEQYRRPRDGGIGRTLGQWLADGRSPPRMEDRDSDSPGRFRRAMDRMHMTGSSQPMRTPFGGGPYVSTGRDPYSNRVRERQEAMHHRRRSFERFPGFDRDDMSDDDYDSDGGYGGSPRRRRRGGSFMGLGRGGRR